MDEWDLEAVYDEQINPLMAQIIAICKANKMPMVATFAYANAEETADHEEKHYFCTTVLQWDGRDPEGIQRAYREIKREPMAFAITITTKEKA